MSQDANNPYAPPESSLSPQSAEKAWQELDAYYLRRVNTTLNFQFELCDSLGLPLLCLARSGSLSLKFEGRLPNEGGDTGWRFDFASGLLRGRQLTVHNPAGEVAVWARRHFADWTLADCPDARWCGSKIERQLFKDSELHGPGGTVEGALSMNRTSGRGKLALVPGGEFPRALAIGLALGALLSGF